MPQIKVYYLYCFHNHRNLTLHICVIAHNDKLKKKFNANSLLALMDSSLTISIRELHGLRYLQHDGDTSTRSLIVASEYALKLEKKAWLCMARQIFEITRMESELIFEKMNCTICSVNELLCTTVLYSPSPSIS